MNEQVKGNYFFTEIAKSEFLQVSFVRIISETGQDNYVSVLDVIRFAEILDGKVLNNKCLNVFIWYYNLYVSRDTRCNLDVKTLKKELKHIKLLIAKKETDENSKI